MKRSRRRRIVAVSLMFLLMELSARVAIQPYWMPGDDLPLLGGYGRPLAQDSDAQDPTALLHDTRWQFTADTLLPDDYTSPSLNYIGGYRVTTGQPHTYKRAVWVVGASQVVGTELADNETIASQLQALLPSTRVVNVGMSGANIAQMEARLKLLPLVSGDTVIVLSGAVEEIGTWRAAHEASGTRLTDGPCAIALHVMPLALVRLTCWREQYATPAAYDDRLIAVTTKSYTPYAATLERIRSDMARRNIQFVNVLTPFCLCVWLSDYDGMTRSIVAFAAAARQDKATVDLSRIVPDEMFYSHFHVNKTGAGIVARALYEAAR